MFLIYIIYVHVLCFFIMLDTGASFWVLYPVVAAQHLSTVGAGVYDIFASIHTKGNETTAQPAPYYKKNPKDVIHVGDNSL